MANKKSGFAYLKEKVAKLEYKLLEAEQVASNERKLRRKAEAMAEKNLLELKAASDQLMRQIEKYKRLADAANKAHEFFGERYVWLYEHAPFWVKWQFKKLFNNTKK